MEGLLLLLVGASSFVLLFGFSNIVLVRRQGCSYADNPVLFGSLFFSCATVGYIFLGLVATFTVPVLALVVLIGCSVVYGCFCRWWQQVVPPGTHGELFELPVEHHDVLRLSGISGLVKICEIAYQQYCAAAVVLGAALLGASIFVTTVVLMIVVYIVHFPGIRLFGRVYGKFFLWSSTLVASVHPLIFFSSPYGVIWMICLHAGVYMCWHVYILRRINGNTQQKTPAF